MKTTLCLVAVMAFSFTAITVAVDTEIMDGNSVSVMETSSTQPNSQGQDNAVPPVPVPDVVPQAGNVPAPFPSQPIMEGPSVLSQPMMAAPVASSGCNSCCATPCCCPPPPVSMTFCLKDPRCCVHEAKVCVPGCCANEQPYITWRNGIFGRQIATLCWKCCDHKVTVIVCRSGKVKVRG